MQRLARGDMEALGALYGRHGAMVKAAIRRHATDAPEAEVEDLCQETFLTVADRAKQYQEQSRFKAWVYGIALHKAKVWRRNTWLRHKLLFRHAVETRAAAAKPDVSVLERTEHAEGVSRALALLSQGQRNAMILHALEGFSCDEIAAMLGIDSKTVRTRIHRARQTLLAHRKRRP